MKKTTILIVGALLCLDFPVLAQERQVVYEPLKLQQVLPASVLGERMQVLDGSGVVRDFTLGSRSGKLVILDFWATWCTACIEAIPRLDSLNARFKGRVEVLLVNANIKGDTLEKMRGRLKGSGMASIINNSSLKQLFPHEYIPHYVWIDGKGRFHALTTGAMVDARAIEGYLSAGH